MSLLVLTEAVVHGQGYRCRKLRIDSVVQLILFQLQGFPSMALLVLAEAMAHGQGYRCRPLRIDNRSVVPMKISPRPALRPKPNAATTGKYRVAVRTAIVAGTRMAYARCKSHMLWATTCQ